MDPAEAAGVGVAGLACVKRVLINSQAYEGIEVSKTSHIFQMSPAHSDNIKEPSRARPAAAAAIVVALSRGRKGVGTRNRRNFFI